MPTFSILMPTYNYRHYLPESVGSLLTQTFGDFEVIISDDCSTDGSWEWITAIEDPRFSWVRAEQNQGVSAAINRALRKASGEFIVVLDPDDRYQPEFLERQLAHFRAHPEVDICGTWLTVIDVDGRPIEDWETTATFNIEADLNDPAWWVWQNRLAHGAAVIRKAAHDRVGEFDESLPITVDWNFWIRCLAAGCRFDILPEPLFISRLHHSNMTHSRPEKLVRSYAKTSAEHLHPFLFSIDRQDLVARNMAGFLNHDVLLESDAAVGAGIMAILAADPGGTKGLLLGLRALHRELASHAAGRSLGEGWIPPGVHVRDVVEAERTRAEYWANRAIQAEGQLWQANSLIGPLQQTVDDLRGQLRVAELALAKLRGRLPIKAAAYANRQRLELQRKRAERIAAKDAQPVASPEPAAQVPLLSIVFVPDQSDFSHEVAAVAAQTLPDWELLVVTDRETPELAPDERVRLVRPQAGTGALEAGVSAARADLLVLLRPGDQPIVTYLETVLTSFARFPGLNVLVPAEDSAAPGSVEAFRRGAWSTLRGASEGQGSMVQPWCLDEDLFRHEKVVATYPVCSVSPRRLSNAEEREASGLVEDPAAAVAAVQACGGSSLTSGKPPVVVFVPWMLRGGGAATFLQEALTPLRDEFDIFVFATHERPAGSASAVREFLAITPHVYDIPTVYGSAAIDAVVRSVMSRLVSPTVLLVGSPWAYENMGLVKDSAQGSTRVVDVQFNHIGHLPKLLAVLPQVDLILVAHQRLSALLVEYFCVSKPVRVLYVAPPTSDEAMAEIASPRVVRKPMRIGWLGRNSPEKRADLVATIALELPEFDFVMAGSQFATLPEQPTNVDVVGWVPDVIEFLADLDFLLNTSDIEGISVSAMEALQLGVPVLTKDVGGMAELVRDGENGIVYSEADLEALALQLRKISLVRHLKATAAEERLPQRFHHAQMVEAMRRALIGM